MDGGAGENIAVFSGSSASYSIATNSDGSFTITDARSDGTGSDVLRNVQFARFSDQTVALGTTPPPPPPVNEAPSDITLSNASVPENSGGGTPVGFLSATDPNAGDAFTYSLVSDPGAKFQIVNDQLQVRPGAVLDYETQSSHQVTIRVTDQSGLSYDEVFTIAVGDVQEGSPNQAPTNLALSGTAVKENSAGGQYIGMLSATDPNAGDTFTYSIVSDPDSKFQVAGSQLQVRQGAILDFETKTSHQLTLRVTDQSGLSYDKSFTISVVDIKNEKIRGRSTSEVLTGSAQSEEIDGSAGNDKISGGLGKDVLVGGKGRDTFVFDTRLSRANVDRIDDYSVKHDTIYLAKKVFSKIGKKGVLKKDAFWIGSKAHDASDRIIYNKKTGAVFYDSDGTGAAKAIKFAILDKNLKLTQFDFFSI
ncbi:cadherin domain-containing protein [Microvirga sp. SM9]|nr:cadherin domain-containing protein [Microvirga lenta]